MDEAHIESGADTTLLQIVRSAATAASGPQHGPVGRLEITNLSQQHTGALVCIEADVSAHGVGWTIEQLDIRVRREQPDPLPSRVLIQLLEQFGSSRFTSLTVFDNGIEVMDFTLSFSSALPFLATNQLLLSGKLSTNDRLLYGEVLKAIGVRARVRGTQLHTPPRQLRTRPTAQAQAQALQLAFDKTRHVDLYTSALPATRAVRIAQQPGSELRTLVDLCISFGLGTGPPTSELAESAEHFVDQAFGVTFRNRSWQVRNAHGQRKDPRTLGSVTVRPRKSWSLNWGQRK